jgi:hypothetical protein
LDRRLCGPQKRSGFHGEEKIVSFAGNRTKAHLFFVKDTAAFRANVMVYSSQNFKEEIALK